ncbi:Putative metalloprotease ypwA [Listeria grayi]|uniref:Metalloprotease ypwA n=1 Tax=Listeria grayi TaxID=1641 RepID=A0A378MAE1_LISGR|nr:Putative metalloprotease ypwA [Listeria grayi]
MSEETAELQAEFLAYIRKIEAVSEALELVFWDLRTKAPAKGMQQRSEVVSVLSSEIFDMKTSTEMAAFIAELAPVKEQLDEVTRKTLEVSQKEYEWNKKSRRKNMPLIPNWSRKAKPHGRKHAKQKILAYWSLI